MFRHKSDNTPHDILTIGDRTLRAVVDGKLSRSVINGRLFEAIIYQDA